MFIFFASAVPCHILHFLIFSHFPLFCFFFNYDCQFSSSFSSFLLYFRICHFILPLQLLFFLAVYFGHFTPAAFSFHFLTFLTFSYIFLSFIVSFATFSSSFCLTTPHLLMYCVYAFSIHFFCVLYIIKVFIVSFTIFSSSFLYNFSLSSLLHCYLFFFYQWPSVFLFLFLL